MELEVIGHNYSPIPVIQRQLGEAAMRYPESNQTDNDCTVITHHGSHLVVRGVSTPQLAISKYIYIYRLWIPMSNACFMFLFSRPESSH